MRNFDVDIEGRKCVAAIHLHHDLVAFNCDMAGDHGDDLLAQYPEQIGMAWVRTLIGEQDLQPLAGYRGGAAPTQQIEQVHAALRPNRRSNNRFLSPGVALRTVSPLSRRAAST